jgi:hypothetical protein
MTAVAREAWESGPPPDDDQAHDDANGAALPPEPPAPWDEHVRPVPADWYTTPPPARTWLLRDSRNASGDGGVLPLGKVGQMIAEGGAGKTMALAQLAVAVATGTRWLGAFDVASPGRVFLALGEEDAQEVHRRLFRAVRASRSPNPPPGSIVVVPLAGVPCAMLQADERGNPVEAPFLPWLRLRLSSEQGWRLVVIDPLSRFAGPDAETDNAAATRFVQALESIATATGATTFATHHTNKLSRGKGGTLDGTAGRGSSAFFDGARWECSLGAERLELDDADTRARLGELVTWTNTKTNYSRKADPVLLRRDLDNGGALVPLDEADLETVKQARGRDPARETKRAAKDAELGEREAAEDVAVDRAVNARPGIPTRDLVAAVRAATRCGGDRAMVAVARAVDRLDVRPGPRNARLYHPRTARP